MASTTTSTLSSATPTSASSSSSSSISLPSSSVTAAAVVSAGASSANAVVAVTASSSSSTTTTIPLSFDDPDKLLNEWLGELENLIGGLDIPNATITTATTTISTTPNPIVNLRRPNSHTSSERNSSYRFSMANLEETHEAELDAILGELSLLEQKNQDHRNYSSGGGLIGMTGSGNNGGMGGLGGGGGGINSRTHSRSNSTISAVTNSTISSISTSSESGTGSGSDTGGSSNGGGCGIGGVTGVPLLREPRTDSPDNDSAFSDTVSLLSSESSASSGVSSSAHHHSTKQHLQLNSNLLHCDSAKAAKIHLALKKLEQASVRRLFVKAFTTDGASKSLLVDERMTCAHVTRLLADKNHVQMEPHWALVEHIPELQIERLFEDHELLVDNLMNWKSDSKNKVLFIQRYDKISLFNVPEKYLPGTQMQPGTDHDEHTRAMLLEEFFSSGQHIPMEGPLYVKLDSKKGWKRYHFMLRASGLYYFPKEKTKSTRDLICLGLFTDNDIYHTIGWKKKHKSPTDYAFAMKPPKEPIRSSSTSSAFSSSSSSKSQANRIKMLCAEDEETMDKWLMAMRVAKYGKQIFDNYRQLMDDLAREELEKFSANRCGSIGSIISSVPSQCSSSTSSSSTTTSSGGGGIGSGNNGGSNGVGNMTGDINIPASLLILPNNNNRDSSASSLNGRLSRASSSSSSGCLSDENNGFDSEFPTGTIKRKPSMKPNLPLTSMTRQLKEVGETNYNTGSGGDSSSNPTSPERGGNGGTLTRRHSRRRSEESNASSGGSGTLKRRPQTVAAVAAAVAAVANRGSMESMSSTSTNSTPTPTPSTPGTPIGTLQPMNLIATSNINNNCSNGGQLGHPGVLNGLGIITSNNNTIHYNHHQHHHLHHHHQQQQQQQYQHNHNNHNIHHNQNNQVVLSPLEIMPSCMTDSTLSLPPPPPSPPPLSSADADDLGNSLNLSGSTLSLESLPPPPPPSELLSNDFSASQQSLVSLPPPPPDIKPIFMSPSARSPQPPPPPSTIVRMIHSPLTNEHNHHAHHHFVAAPPPPPAAATTTTQAQAPASSINGCHTLPNHMPSYIIETPPQPIIYSKTIKPSIKAPPYKSPPPYNNNNGTPGLSVPTPPPPVPPTKSVSFADSPVLLRRKVCFDDEIHCSSSPQSSPSRRSTATISSISSCSSSVSTAAPPPPPRAEATRLSTLYTTSPKRLADSTSNPPRDFLKDLQRVMRKKWQVAQKCKLEPATTPHEVLGFRDFNGELQPIGGSTHFYRETSNVSNWVQEHYGTIGGSDGTAIIGGGDSLYENVTGGGDVIDGAELLLLPPPILKKRPPPPPPKRSQTTQLTTNRI